MASQREQIEALIRGLETQRGLLGDAFVEAGLAPLRERLSALIGQAPAELGTRQTLKLVTIVFLDVVGSTRLSQHLDPEDIHTVMDGALARCTAVVQAHQGKVLQYAGDNLLAVFGAERSREDDAERAVRCALALLAEGRALGEQVSRQHGHPDFGVRVGVHTGNVLLGGGVDGDASIRGIAVNVAARMEQTAPPGGVRISHATWRQVHGAFDVQPQAPIAVKGVDEPVLTYLVQGARPRAFHATGRGIEGVHTRIVGRDAELSALEEALRRVVAGRRLSMVTVVAEAGLGKSRLLLEFERRLGAAGSDMRIVRGRATPQTPGQPFGLLRDTLAWQLRIVDTDSAEEAKHKVETGIAPFFVADDGTELAQAHAHLLGHLIGFDFSDSPHVAAIRDDPRQLRNRAFHTAAQLLRRIAGQDEPKRGALLLLIEDLHWADDGSLQFLDYLLDANTDTAILVVALTRPALFERHDDICTAPHARIVLGALDQARGRELVGELLQRLGEVPPALVEFVAVRAEGNPFYMEELIKLLIERGAIATAAANWTLLPQRLLHSEIPATLTGVLQARLDSLPRSERQTLQQASVIGHVFWDQTLAELDARAPAALPALQRRELVLPHSAAVDEVREFAFSHKILHDVTYDTVLKRRRRELHARAADWLARRAPARASEWLAAAAEHYALAGNLARSAEFFARAAEHARSRHAHETALAHTARALALCNQLDDADAALAAPDRLALRWRLQVVREFTFGQLGRRDEQPSALHEMQQLADALDDDLARALAARRRSQFGLRTGDYALQEAAAREALRFASRAGADESRLEAQRLLADALGAQGRFDEGQTLARAGLAEARALGLRRVEGVLLNALSLMAGLQDDQVAGLQFDLQDLPIWRELGDKQGECVALANVGADWLWFGQLEQAQLHLQEALRLARAIGARQTEIGPLVDLALLALWQGDAQRAVEIATQAIELAMAIRSPEFEADAWCTRGNAELALGDLPAARSAFERAETLATSIGHGRRHHARAGRARVASAQGDSASALGHVETLLAQRASGESWHGVDARLVLWSCHLVLSRAGDARAAQLLASAHAELRSRAATIGDAALRASFVANVPHHRAIADAWAARC